jgi:glycosyltransferase involved in cell wall biosynthesis
LVFYHFFHPDDVAGARQFSDLAEEQARRGWEVTAVTSNRACHDAKVRFPRRESWRGVDVRRVFRPAWPQARALPRLGNSAFLLGAWSAAIPTLPPADAAVIGSDPAFAPLLALALRAARRRLAILHWCFDLYPEAIVADRLSEREAVGSRERRASGPALARPLVLVAGRMVAAAYRACDVLVDLGPTMRARLAAAAGGARRHETLTPWALTEPPAPLVPDARLRAALFPGARLALLYAGTLGRAHDFELFLALARACRERSGRAIQLCFASRGNRQAELEAALRPDDVNVSLAPFASEAELEARLGAADLHLVSLRPEWAGVVVPSKLYGSLAAGRPVLYAGPEDSEIAALVRELGVGLCLARQDDVPRVAARLEALAADPAPLAGWQARAHAAYGARFSKRIVNDRWDGLLREVVASRRALSP